MEKIPFISIIMPVYNAEKYMEQAIESVISQTYQNWELILVDDCSEDGSGNIAGEYVLKDKRILYYKLEKNSGAAEARNFGMKKAEGTILCFLDSDDLWRIDKLEKEYCFMKKYDAPIVFSAYDLIDESGKSLNKIVHVPEKINYKEHLYNHIIWTSVIMIDTEKTGKFEMPGLSSGEDVATWLLLLKRCGYAYGIDEILASYRQVKGSLSDNLKQRLSRAWKIYRIIEKFSVLESMFYYILHALVTLKKRKKVL